MTSPPALQPLDVATGMVLGAERRPPPLPPVRREPVLSALERAVLPALLRPPCLVSFSGGQDSSAVLAVAAAVARRERLPEPIPATNRFSGVPAADERAWQEQVVAHLGLADWVRLELGDELDVTGPYAQRVLRTCGLAWPFNVHFHLPLLEAAGEGSVLTGIGGDELFAAACGRPGGRHPRAIARALFEMAPARVRHPVLTRRHPLRLPWLTGAGGREATAAAAGHDAGEPRGSSARLAWARAMRSLAVGPSWLDAVAGLTSAQVVHPLLDRGVWSAVAREAGRTGFDSRRHGMRRLFGALLPSDVVERRDKACFDAAFFTARAREEAARWTGAGVPAELVDVEALAAHWQGTQPMAQSFTLLQAAWLASAADGESERGAGVGERAPAARALQHEHR